MLAILESVRDALIALALSWVGVTYEPAPEPIEQRCGGGQAACQSSGGSMSRPRFDTATCPAP